MKYVFAILVVSSSIICNSFLGVKSEKNRSTSPTETGADYFIIKRVRFNDAYNTSDTNSAISKKSASSTSNSSLSDYSPVQTKRALYN